MLSRTTLPLAAASKGFRVITRDEIQKRIELALDADRKLRAERLHEEAKARILEARATLQEAIREIERIKAREAELLARIEQLRNENSELREELRHFVENAKTEAAAPVATNGHNSPLVERSAWDGLAARVARLEELLAAHLLQDHRSSSEEDPPESNGRNKRRRLR